MSTPIPSEAEVIAPAEMRLNRLARSLEEDCKNGRGHEVEEMLGAALGRSVVGEIEAGGDTYQANPVKIQALLKELLTKLGAAEEDLFMVDNELTSLKDPRLATKLAAKAPGMQEGRDNIDEALETHYRNWLTTNQARIEEKLATALRNFKSTEMGEVLYVHLYVDVTPEGVVELRFMDEDKDDEVVCSLEIDQIPLEEGRANTAAAVEKTLE